MTRNRHKPKQINGSGGETKMSGRKQYVGNARFIEIGAEGQPLRLTFNVDKIESLRFERLIEERQLPTGPGTPATYDDEGVELTAALPAPTATQRVPTGWQVTIAANGAQSGINFGDLQEAMGCYNHIINMLKAVGVPHVFMGILEPPEESAGLVDPSGKIIEDAVDAVDLHPDLAGGEGDGIAENDDDVDPDFELSEEDLALLENPEFDDSIGEEVEAQAEVDPSEDPPAH